MKNLNYNKKGAKNAPFFILMNCYPNKSFQL